MNAIEKFFLLRYKDASFMIQQKAKTLMYFELILAVLLPFLLIALNIVGTRTIFSPINITILSINLMLLVSLSLLKNGNYYVSANLIVIFCAIAIGLLIITGKVRYNIGIVTSTYHTIILIIFSVLFCKGIITLIVSILVLGSGISAMIITNLLEKVEINVVITNFAFEVVFVAVLCYLISRVNNAVMKRLEEEIQKKEHSNKITNELLKSVQETSVKLFETMNSMTQMSVSFADNAQKQTKSTNEIESAIEKMYTDIDKIVMINGEQYGAMASLIKSMEEFSNLLNEVKRKTDDTLQVTTQMSQKTVDGQRLLMQMDESIKNIGKLFGDVMNAIKTIKDISSKITFLSINASIESARAGEAGRGFAVVAKEISKLADTTSSKVKDIDSLIKMNKVELDKGLTGVNDTVNIFTRIIEEIETIDSMVRTISDYMDKQVKTNITINDRVEQIKAHSEKIKTATEEQKISSKKILKSISNINEFTQSNAAGSEELVATSEEIKSLAEYLKNKVNSLEGN